MSLQKTTSLKKCNVPTFPKKHFIQDLAQFITIVLGQNNKVIVAADTNEHIIDGVLPEALKNLGLIEAHMKKFDLPGPASKHKEVNHFIS